tara:strand:+ start:4556 stop:5599 length:1044 start_codon:yes stop_codon:yes gene_type:complete
MSEMVCSICSEIKQRKGYLNNKDINTIYFGGGTPSLLSLKETEKILNEIYKNYNVSGDAEITCEANPDDLTKIKLTGLKKLGVNRLSIGIQSFIDKDLKFLNRSHSSEQAIKCVKEAQEVGFNNISVDLIYGIPNQTFKQWIENLNTFFSLEIQHFSAYSLTIEEKTKLAELVKIKKVTPVTEKKNIKQFEKLLELAEENKFIHYEISNFGKKGFFSKHNTSYWQNKLFLGVGPSAHSFNGNSRRWNVSSNKKYIENIKLGISFYEEEKLDKNKIYNEYILTNLRTIWGINLSKVGVRFGDKIKTHLSNELKKWINKEYLLEQDGVYILSKKGRLFADKISSDLFII